jgi:hypothetical protein
VNGAGHKFYMDNYVSSPDLFDDPHTAVELSDKIIKECQKASIRRH